MMMGVMRIILLFWASLALVTGQVSYEILQSNILSCCHYCRSEPKHWVSVKGGVQIKPKIEATSLDNPPAYLVSDEEEVEFNNEGRGYKLNYAGALLKMKYEDLNNVDGLLNEQYMQIDMAEPKFVGGILTQGGFYEEKLLGLIPYQESWVTRFVLSYSNSSSKDFQLYKTETGVTQTFTGNYDVTHSKLSSLVPAIVARYVRYHPLLAQNEAGAVDQASMRVTAVTCQADLCATTRINCLLTQWSTWSECTCEAGCSQARTRSVRRVQACGGSRCGSLREQQTCTPPEPAWKSAVQYGGIALGVILLIAVIAFVIYKKTHKDRVEVIVVKENDDDDRHKRPGMMGGHHPRPNGPPMGFRPPGAPQPGAMRGPSMPPNFTGFGARPQFATGAPGMRPRFPPPGMGAPGQAPPGGMPSINN